MKDKLARDNILRLEKLIGRATPLPGSLVLYGDWTACHANFLHGSGLAQELQDIRDYLGIEYITTPASTKLTKVPPAPKQGRSL